MKKHFTKTLTLIAFTMLSFGAFAQVPPPPPSGHGSGGNQPADGGGAALTGGIGVLMALGGAYGGKKLYKAWKKKNELEE